MSARKQINLALQGGGSHGAFTWGALDRLLQDDRIEIVEISGASAGAMNAVVLAEGHHQGGPEGARAALREFWGKVGQAAALSPMQRGPINWLNGDWSLDSNPAYLAMDLLSRVASPYDLNPFDFNPLRDALLSVVDFKAVRACEALQLHIAATDVETGRGRIFERHEITADAVMASAALPHLFKAVEVGGHPYWDGGYVGNPPLFPFYDASPSNDILIIQINPLIRAGAPRTAREIADRLNEITFNGALLGELRSIDFVRRLIEEGRLSEQDYRRMRLHMIGAAEELAPLGASSKLNAESAFLTHLFEIGRGAASRWLEAHFDDLGARGTLDLRGMLGRPPRKTHFSPARKKKPRT